MEATMTSHRGAAAGANTLERRKFHNPTPSWVGACKFNTRGDGFVGVAVEPGGDVWLSPEEEQATAEAPRSAEDNPFIKQWDRPVAHDEFGHVLETVPEHGVLVPSEEPPRPLASDRYTPSSDDRRRALERDVQAEAEAIAAAESGHPGEEEVTADRQGDEEDEQTAGPGQETRRRVERAEPAGGDEIVGTPDATERNDESREQRARAKVEDGTTPVGPGDAPRGQEVIGVPPRR